ncbi:PH domain-containing protein [Amycolatopsis cynarae]|uniref:PH domain-containing protein n=1 Tax=Amycolatopsis cynarae TaxID=2995223 RepID=A0ABY7B0T3_9PSEU|nr:PH domain-containing protein [Amycolatopsis sp. HUAS 11-8]WAL65570.1 PH domain-containing protein [Amycolatopsis sp. HUAS 11-8]
MDNYTAHWAPQPALVALGWLAAAAALAGAVLYADPRGALLLGVAAMVLLALSVHGSVVRPRLAADPRGVRVRTAHGAHEFTWPETRTTLRTAKRLGRDSTTLEISAGDHLFVFGRLELGADPREVLDALANLRG